VLLLDEELVEVPVTKFLLLVLECFVVECDVSKVFLDFLLNDVDVPEVHRLLRVRNHSFQGCCLFRRSGFRGLLVLLFALWLLVFIAACRFVQEMVGLVASTVVSNVVCDYLYMLVVVRVVKLATRRHASLSRSAVTVLISDIFRLLEHRNHRRGMGDHRFLAVFVIRILGLNYSGCFVDDEGR